MLAARMYGYKQPLVIEDVKTPEPAPDEVLVKVTAAGICRTDYQLVDGYFRQYMELPFPSILGHEIVGTVDKIGSLVPKESGLAEGDQVVVSGGWGDGSCRMCLVGNTNICAHGRWAGFGDYGGFAEYIPVPAKYLIKADKSLKPEELAPLTDAGITPYRGIKKLQQAGVFGPGRVLAVMGVGGLGIYGVQYAKLLSGGSTVVAFARSDDKLAIARENGADHVINTRGKSLDAIRGELASATGHTEVDAVIDCVGSEETIKTGFGLLATSGAYSSVGLVGNHIDIPLFPLVAREYTYYGSFWGNMTDLTEVVRLAEQGRIKHTVKPIKLEDINENLELLGAGEIVGRAVVVF